MTEEELAKLEAKVLGGAKPVQAGAGASPSPAPAPPVSSAEAQRAAIGTPGETDSAANAAGYAFVDKATLGALPWLRDKIADLAGNTTQLRRDEQRAFDEQNHPVASTAGAIAGTMAPALTGVGAAGAAGRAGVPLLGNALGANIAGSAAANLADQGARAILDDKPFDPGDLALSAASGALAAPVQAAKLVATAKNPLVATGLWGLKKGLGALSKGADEAAAAANATRTAAADAVDAAAAQTASSKTADAAWKAGRKASMGADDLAGYAADDPIAQFAREARAAGHPESAPLPPRAPMEGLRPGQIQPGSPMWEEMASRIRGEGGMRPPPPPPVPDAPIAAPPPLISARTLAPVTAKESADTISGEAENEKRRRRQARAR